MKLSKLQSPTGALLYARTVSGGSFELAGAPTASGVREIVDELAASSECAIVDGAVDRVAALAGSQGAIVVACGAAAAKTMQRSGRRRRRTRRAPTAFRASIPHAPAIEIAGALTPGRAADFVAERESRQIVVRDPTQIALSGRAASRALSRLAIRCRRPLRVVAATVASIGAERVFEPRGFADAVAEATGLPTFDVYAGTRAA